jgi:hypothetical protein
MIPQHGWVTEEMILISPAKSSQKQPSDTGTNDAAIAKTAVVAAGAPMAAEPPGATTEGSMGDNVDDNTLPGSAVDNAAQAPTGQKGQQHTSSGLWSPSCMPWMCSRGLTVAGARLSTTYGTRSLQHTSIFWFLICSIGSDWNRGGNQSGVVSTVCLKRMAVAARSAIASGAAVGSRLLRQIFLVVLGRCGEVSNALFAYCLDRTLSIWNTKHMLLNMLSLEILYCQPPAPS